jgi:hypothetical protein
MSTRPKTRPPWASRRWTVIVLGLVALMLLQLLGASDAVLGPLATGVGGAMAALQVGESWVDRHRRAEPEADDDAPEDRPEPRPGRRRRWWGGRA